MNQGSIIWYSRRVQFKRRKWKEKNMFRTFVYDRFDFSHCHLPIFCFLWKLLSFFFISVYLYLFACLRWWFFSFSINAGSRWEISSTPWRNFNIRFLESSTKLRGSVLIRKLIKIDNKKLRFIYRNLSLEIDLTNQDQFRIGKLVENRFFSSTDFSSSSEFPSYVDIGWFCC